MIFDHIGNHEKYGKMHPYFREAFAFLANAGDLQNGRHELSGGMYANVSEGDARPEDEMQFEAHRKYIDLQFLISGSERLIWGDGNRLPHVTEYSEENDCYFLSGKGQGIDVYPGDFYILYPEDAHKPGCSAGMPSHYRKIIVKVPVL